VTDGTHTEVDHSDIDYLHRRVAALTKENDFLRAYTGNSAKACVYCGLGAEEQFRCKSGFPGCARADDQMLCREIGSAMERDQYAAELAGYQRALKCANDQLAQLDPTNARAVFAVPFTDEEMRARRPPGEST
jgi:hypothetical protein